MLVFIAPELGCSTLRAQAIVGAVVVLQDLTEQEQIEADFEERVARLVSIGVELEGAAVRRDGQRT